mgnify:CR=1 FL=1|tara:strand:- start:54 stop:329 length:276 start_codon:yes stop_codon:yes gene_type:complete
MSEQLERLKKKLAENEVAKDKALKSSLYHNDMAEMARSKSDGWVARAKEYRRKAKVWDSRSKANNKSEDNANAKIKEIKAKISELEIGQDE